MSYDLDLYVENMKLFTLSEAFHDFVLADAPLGQFNWEATAYDWRILPAFYPLRCANGDTLTGLWFKLVDGELCSSLCYYHLGNSTFAEVARNLDQAVIYFAAYIFDPTDHEDVEVRKKFLARFGKNISLLQPLIDEFFGFNEYRRFDAYKTQTPRRCLATRQEYDGHLPMSDQAKHLELIHPLELDEDIFSKQRIDKIIKFHWRDQVFTNDKEGRRKLEKLSRLYEERFGHLMNLNLYDAAWVTLNQYGWRGVSRLEAFEQLCDALPSSGLKTLFYWWKHQYEQPHTSTHLQH